MFCMFLFSFCRVARFLRIPCWFWRTTLDSLLLGIVRAGFADFLPFCAPDPHGTAYISCFQCVVVFGLSVGFRSFTFGSGACDCARAIWTFCLQCAAVVSGLS